MKILLIGEIHPEAEKLLRTQIDVHKISYEQFGALSFPHEAEAIVLRTFTLCKKNELDKFPHLKYVVSCSVGVDNLDLEEMKKRGIELIHVPATNANSVAEHTLYLILSLLREDSQERFMELKWKTVGIVGFGAIGKMVAQKLGGFGCRVIAFDVISQDSKVLQELKVEMKSLEDVLTLADVVTIHVPLFPQTQGMINAAAFERMKEGSFFVNTSRAEIIDEEALVQHQSKFRGIGLDVYSEGLKKKLKENVLFTPHVAARGEDSFREQCMKPVETFLKRIKK